MLTSYSHFKEHQLVGSCEEYYYIGYLNGGMELSGLADSTGVILPAGDWSTPYWWHAWYHTYSQQLRTELRIVYNSFRKLNIVTGLEYRSSHIQGTYVVSMEENPEETSSALGIDGGNHFFSRDFGFFTQVSYHPFDFMNIVAGGRIDNNRTRITGGYGTQINPKVALILTPHDFIIKVIYSEAFMDASYWTKYGTTPGRLLSNPTLQPEKIRNKELSIGWKINDFLFAEAVAYHANYEGAVGTKEVTFVNDDGETIATTQHQPIGSLKIQGIQSRVNFKYNNYSAYANYTFTNPYKLEEDEKIRIGDIASHQINFGVNALFFRRLNINLRMNWVGAKPTGENTTISSNPLNEIDMYYTLNGAITYTVYKRISLQLSVFNILNREYFHPGVRSANGGYYASQMPQNERSFMGKLIIEL